MKIQIKSWITGDIKFEHTADNNTIKLTVEAAVKAGFSLRGANLRGANLRGADLLGADLRDANLRGADLRGADLSCADLLGANLRGANLLGADLRDANLRGANLRQGVKASGRRPLLQIGPIGSREATLSIWITNKGLRIEAGCFFGTRDEFEAVVDKCHVNNIHAEEYVAALMLADIHFELWKPTDEEIAELENEEAQS